MFGSQEGLVAATGAPPAHSIALPAFQNASTSPRGSAALTVNSIKQLAECLHADLTHRSLEKYGQCDLEAFDRFVAQWPGVFCALLKLLLPLCFQANAYIREEMFLTEKGMAHSNGELRARMSNMGSRHQLYLLGWVHQRYIRPQLDALRKERSKRPDPKKAKTKTLKEAEDVMGGTLGKLAMIFTPRG